MKICLAFLALALTACSTSLKVAIPNARVESPLVVGDAGDFGYRFGAGPSSTYRLTDRANERPVPDLGTAERLSESVSVFGAGTYLLTEGLEGSFGASESGTQAQLKYQFYGPSLENAADGDVVASVYMTYARNGNSINGDQKDTFGAGGYKWRANASATSVQGGVSIGKRIAPDRWAYLGLAHARENIDGTIDQDAADGGASPEAHYRIGDYDGTNQTFALGFVRVGDSVRTDLQIGINRHRLRDVATDNGFVAVTFSDVFSKRKTPEQIVADEEMVPKERWKAADFGAVFCSWIVGFGCGQNMQNRWKSRGRYFAMADGVGLGMAAAGLLANGFSGSSLVGAGFGVFFVSRFWQIGDVVYDASRARVPKSQLDFWIAPGPAPGVAAMYTF